MTKAQIATQAEGLKSCNSLNKKATDLWLCNFFQAASTLLQHSSERFTLTSASANGGSTALPIGVIKNKPAEAGIS